LAYEKPQFGLRAKMNLKVEKAGFNDPEDVVKFIKSCRKIRNK
jgi:hypothetical protein